MVREEPLLIEVPGGGRVLTMRTPGRDHDLALGFLLAEGIIEDPGAVTAVDVLEAREPQPDDPTSGAPATVRVHLQDPAQARVEGRLTRTHEVRPSCGVCGADDIDALLDSLPPLLPGTPQLEIDDLPKFATTLRHHQPLFDATGGSHAAAVFDASGTLLSSAEDIGRHNALDKALGAAARAGHPLERAVVMLSGRAGYDLVMKCLRVRVPVILSVSAASALSFDLCRDAGATLVGFVRDSGRSGRVYCSASRLRGID